MNRRNFIQKSTLATFAVTSTLNLTSCQETTPKIIDKTPVFDSQKDDFILNEITIDELQSLMQSGKMTAKNITELYLNRIQSIDKQGIALNSVIEINPDALQIADALDQERKAGKVRGPMHGIPILIKDNIDTKDKMMTTAGALALEGNIPNQDAFIVQQLRSAGAIIIGKTNLSEWANFRSTRSSSGWSSRGGQTKNPCVLYRNPCGSSSGSGAAVAANFCAVAVGTETDGSVIAPASFCGVVGMKPTVGLLSRSGIIPISKTQDTAGPMTRTVKDTAILLAAMVGIDPNDAVTLESKGKSNTDYTSFLDKNALKNKRIGFEKSFLEGNSSVVAIYKAAMEVLKAQGANLIEVDLLSQTNPLGDAEYTILKYQFKDGVNRYLSTANAKVKTLAEVISFNKQNEAKAMPFFKQEILESCEAMGDLNSKEYLSALSNTLKSRKIIDDLLKKEQLDAIIGTSIGLPNLTDLYNGDYSTGFYFCPPAAMAGYPHITVPMGKVNELPIGLSIVASAYQEGLLLGLAYAYEQASLQRKQPKFLKTI
jgi:amidase